MAWETEKGRPFSEPQQVSRNKTSLAFSLRPCDACVCLSQILRQVVCQEDVDEDREAHRRPLQRRLSPLGLLVKEASESGFTLLQPIGLPNLSPSLGKLGWREGTCLYHSLFLDRKCVMEWEEPHDSTLYCLQTDGNHLLATGSSYYGVVRLWDRRQRACLNVSVPTSTCLCCVKTRCGLHWRPVTGQRCSYGTCPCFTGSGSPESGYPFSQMRHSSHSSAPPPRPSH